MLPIHSLPPVGPSVIFTCNCDELQLTNPLDVVKIRQQLDGELGQSSRRYGNFLVGLRTIAVDEGKIASDQ